MAESKQTFDHVVPAQSNRLLRDSAVVGVLAFALRAALIAQYPLVYGGDPIIRLIESDRILISYQHPGLQAAIYSLHALGGGVLGSRLLVAALSAVGAAGLTCLTALRWPRRVSLLAGLIYACNPFCLFFSAVPYQFPLVLAASHWGLYFWLRRAGRWRLAASSLCFGVACLTRYEAWILVACVAAAWMWNQVRSRASSGKSAPLYFVSQACFAALLFGWAPLAWLVFQRGISPSGTFVIGGVGEWGQLLRPLTTAAVLLGLSGPLTVALAAIGLGTARQAWRGPARDWWVFGALWIVCSAIALVYSAHPVEPPAVRLSAAMRAIGLDPTPAMFVTPREGHLYLSLLSLLAALGVARIWAGVDFIRNETDHDRLPCVQAPRPRWRAVLAIVLFVSLLIHGVWLGTGRIRRANDDPNLLATAAAATAIDRRLAGGGRALVLAKRLPSADIQKYLNQARRAGGLEGLHRAKHILASIETGPWSYQRLLVHSRYDRGQLFDMDDFHATSARDLAAALRVRDVRYCVIFDDFVAETSAEHQAAALAEAGELVEAPRGVRVYDIGSSLPTIATLQRAADQGP